MITNKGYRISIEDSKVSELKKELTVSPFIPGNKYPVKHLMYRVSDKYFYTPKYFGIKKFGIPEISKKVFLVDNSPKDILDKMLEAYEKNEKVVKHDIAKFSSKRMGENFAKLYKKLYKKKD